MPNVRKEVILNKIITVLTKEGAKHIGIFGSYAKNLEKKGSDIDVLVEFVSDDKSLIDMARIKRLLSETTGKKIDLLTRRAISPYLIGKISKEEKVIYDR